MGLFRKATQCITISSETRDALEALVFDVNAIKLKDAKVSSVKYEDDEWQCRITCKRAEEIYYQEIIPLLYDPVETQSFTVTLEFDDESELVKRCPAEILVSFSLNSRYAFGDKVEQEFTQKIHKDILHSHRIKPAAVCYYIVGGGAVTMSIPCLEMDEMEGYLRSEFEAHGIKEIMINRVEREQT